MAERDIGSLRMMGWGLMLAENSSVVAAAVTGPPGGFYRKCVISKEKVYFLDTYCICVEHKFSDLGCFDRFDDGKLNNSTLLNS